MGVRFAITSCFKCEKPLAHVCYMFYALEDDKQKALRSKERNRYSSLTFPMLRLLSSKVQGSKDL